ncbi:hypothetical protein RhiirA5_406882 [Rhizophagus irregularis]|uniref:Uncharacterized protein n=2 Tax=Rhizophagus irregularis TaxID=588596 RepID=A0A2I1E533_9GLOM|nr:hypothetical protein GLOIN_2v1762321 [Rhizophagus irregularis DAOM 181602=DAOM 197198]PKC16570.1 hypothetical protein RhiirA5_406882 [Rhizophagus irregularis]PKC75344.1 hypothetical protein RhiirA1_448914 [Rhizophagus irregularis]PKY17242.1 hypothetical protein RhiirB3_429801 [Rhizophagus irregularis]POG82126.1 hypothetical protein GLOIN_2v1762321 [Rhizophagus irregularis DAOM 181602=DAOM 197198]CAB5204780.1 unnamed protein product [Rhizophagus irregularis]|eukprot:XP_025188992.1 hypothetical protein GLOIN_2v1762321 [Rhizophagus irregularis DAOM 181602=DAOM 197198]
MDISDGNIDFIIDATHGVGHMWESIEDDNTIPEGSKEVKRAKTYQILVGTYKSVTGENPNKKSRLAQKETKKCDCESYFFIIGTLKRQRVCQLINEALCDVPVRDQVRAREHRNHSHSTSNTGSFTIQASIDYVVRIFTGYGVPYRFRVRR